MEKDTWTVITRRRKIIGMLPFLTICVIMLYTWSEFLFGEYIPERRHYAALFLVLLNAVIYFKRYKRAMLLTGIILILGTINLVSFLPGISVFSIMFMDMGTPGIQTPSFLLLIAFCAINHYLLINWHMDWKEKKRKKRLRNR